MTVQTELDGRFQVFAAGDAHAGIIHFGIGSPGLRDGKRGPWINSIHHRMLPPSALPGDTGYGPGAMVIILADWRNPGVPFEAPKGAPLAPPVDGFPFTTIMSTGQRVQVFQAEVSGITADARGGKIEGQKPKPYKPGRAAAIISLNGTMKVVSVR